MTPEETRAGHADGGYPAGFANILQRTIDAHKNGGDSGALLVFAIDNVTMILSAFGHETSEHILKSMEDEVRRLLSPEDTLERLQKDQFGIILPCIEDDDLRFLAERIYTLIEGFGHQCDYGSLLIQASMACMRFPEPFGSAWQALDQAYISLRTRRGLNFRGLEDNAQESALCRQELGLANYLSKALRENRLRLAFQPIIDSCDGSIAHYEALLRIAGEDGALSSAGALIPIAERMGLIRKIDTLVLEKVVRELEIAPDVTLAFNVSGLTTGDRDWLRRLKELIGDHPDIASRMIVEITETAAHRDLSKAAFFVASVQALGAQVALDDFGAGYTSFRQLKSLSVDLVKIDGAFIRDLADSADNRFFVKTLLDFTKGFGLKAVAEFVETGEVAKLLMELGVEYMQGYYFGKPQCHRSWLKEDR